MVISILGRNFSRLLTFAICSFFLGDTMSVDKDDIPLILRIRAAIATALGAAAAHAKLLADQEEREIEYLLAIMMETQVNHSLN